MRKTILAALAVVVGTAMPAFAGETGKSGVYLRAEGGYSWARDAGIDNTGSDSNTQLLIDKLDEVGTSPFIGGGVGYRFTPAFRADLTVGYRWGFQLDDVDAANASTSHRADIKSLAVMLNGYVDVADLAGVKLGVFKPYIGGGLGIARNKIDSYTYEQAGQNLQQVPGGSTTNLAWQLSAGTGIVVTPGLLLDVGYRYSDFGKVKNDNGEFIDSITGPTGTAIDPVKGDLRSHDIMVGIRYEL